MEEFLAALRRFTNEVEAMPRFKGKAQAVSSLKRIANLAAFK